MDEESGNRPTPWAFRVGRGLLGVPVTLHWTLLVTPFFLYFAWVKGYPDASQVRHGRIFGEAVVQTVLLMVFVYLHELGHALAGLRTRTHVPEIQLTPLGGAALMGQRMRSANHEMVVVLAGPMVTLMLMGLFYAGYHFGLPDVLSAWTGSEMVGSFFIWGFYVNAAMGILNLLPMMPLDGGKAFRAFLAFKTAPPRATHVATVVGQVVAALMAIGGVYLLFKGGGLWPCLLLVYAFSGFASCIHERMLAREGLVYAEGEYAWGDDAESWKSQATPAAKPSWWARWMERRRLAREERERTEVASFRGRVDELLAKVKRDGMDSLTKAERRVLDEAATRFRKEQNGRQRG